MRTLITGINGFTGYHLAALLRGQEWEVAGTYAGLRPEGPERIFECELGDSSRLEEIFAEFQPEAVVHLAAISFVAHGDVSAIYRTNLLGTLNLLQACANHASGLKKVVLASSANVYGNVDSEQIDESMPPTPLNHYAVSKLAMEQAARLWENLPIIIVRPFNYTGVGQSEKFLLPKIVAHFRRGDRKIDLGNTDVAREFSDVRRVVEIYRRLLISDVGNDTFNICSGHVHSLREVLTMMRDIAGYEIEVNIREDLIRPNEIKRLGGSCRRLESAIGALPHIPLQETLRWMFEAP